MPKRKKDDANADPVEIMICAVGLVTVSMMNTICAVCDQADEKHGPGNSITELLAAQYEHLEASNESLQQLRSAYMRDAMPPVADSSEVLAGSRHP